jgi:regulator of sigma E protease
VPVTVDRGGQSVTLSFHVPATVKSQDFDISDTGLLEQFVPGPIGVQEVQPGMPAAQAGLRAGDAIQSVDGHTFHYVNTLLAYMQAGEGKPVTLVILRNGVALPPVVAHPTKLDAGWKLGFAPVPIPFRNNPLPLNKAVDKSAAFCADNSSSLSKCWGASSPTRFPSPSFRPGGHCPHGRPGCGDEWMAAQVRAGRGHQPQPGHSQPAPLPHSRRRRILLLLIESVMRRDISINVKERIYQAAFVVLLAFFAFVIFNDVTKLPIFAHLKP